MRLQTRPTWLAVTVAAFTGYCIGRPGTIVGAFREDGLGFVVVGFVVAAVIGGSIVEVRRERAAAQLPVGMDRMRDAMRRITGGTRYDDDRYRP